MLGLDQDMEADLGIDSIKRVEIFGALRDLSGGGALAGDSAMEAIAKLKTLRDVLAFVAENSAEGSAPAPAPTALNLAVKRPFLHGAATIEETPGQSLVLRIVLDLSEHKYLRDHSLYFWSTERDNQADRIYVMPLTGSVELMCEGAALLQPGALVTGVKNVQVLRRLATMENQPGAEVDIVAKRIGPGEIAVSLRAAGQTGAPYSSCIVQMGAAYAAAPAPMEISLADPKAPMCPGKDIYEQHRMFHGPSFQGIHSISSVGENGLLANLEILPTENLVGSDKHPQYHLDPHLLDAAGQLVGYWPVEYLAEGYVILPVRIADITKFCENPPVGSVNPCRLRIREVAERTITADYDILTPEGNLWLRVTGWMDWRFYWTQRIFDFWRFPKSGYCSLAPEIPSLAKTGLECRYMSAAADFEKDSLSEQVLTRVILDRSELAQYDALAVADRPLWLFTRAVAKDALRAWIKRTHNRDLFPADIHLVPKEAGVFHSEGFWTTEFPAPQVSTFILKDAVFAVAGTDRAAVAAALTGQSDVDSWFLPDEVERLNSMADPGEGKARAFAAKLAAAAFLRPGADSAYPRSLIMRKIRADNESFEIADPDMAINAEDVVSVATGALQGMTVAVAYL
jgi:hypothetical protein